MTKRLCHDNVSMHHSFMFPICETGGKIKEKKKGVQKLFFKITFLNAVLSF